MVPLFSLFAVALQLLQTDRFTQQTTSKEKTYQSSSNMAGVTDKEQAGTQDLISRYPVPYLRKARKA